MTPTPGVDRLACTACGRSFESCQSWEGGVFPCCGLCRHKVRSCQGNDAAPAPALREAAQAVDASWFAIEDGENVRMRYASDLPRVLNELRRALAAPAPAPALDRDGMLTEAIRLVEMCGASEDLTRAVVALSVARGDIPPAAPAPALREATFSTSPVESLGVGPMPAPAPAPALDRERLHRAMLVHAEKVGRSHVCVGGTGSCRDAIADAYEAEP